MGNLYIVSTPIGNLQDITLRAVAILRSVTIIACEDTRKAGILLKYLQETFPGNTPVVKPTLLSYYEDNEFARMPHILNALHNDIDVALISDAGTPTISDPGFKLVRECAKEGINVISVPGASSVMAALTSSGLPTDKFLFVGYFPRKEGNRDKFLNELKESLSHVKTTVIFFEAPHRLKKTLEGVQGVFGDIDIVITRELTKIHEEILRGKVSTFVEKYTDTDPKGELVILFNLGEQQINILPD